MVSRLVKQGGGRGIGVTMITQRPAAINKDVLSQVDILTVLRMGHPKDIAAVTEWMKSEVSPEFAREVGEALPSLPRGTAYICSAALDFGKRVDVRERRTFNSGATPEPGQGRREAKVLAPVDLARLGREVAESAQRVEESSPAYLRRRIAELEAAKARPTNGASERELTRLRGELAAARVEAEQVPALKARLAAAEAAAQQTLDTLRILVAKLDGGAARAISSTKPERVRREALPTPAQAEVDVPEVAGRLTSGEQKVLDALAKLEAVGVDAPSKVQIAGFAGYSNANSGGFAAPTGALVKKGMVQSNAGPCLADGGRREAANRPARPATEKELQGRILSMLGQGEQRLTLLIGAHPEAVKRVDLAERAGYSNANSGGFAAPLARLVELGFAERVGAGTVRGSNRPFLNSKRKRDEAATAEGDVLSARGRMKVLARGLCPTCYTL